MNEKMSVIWPTAILSCIIIVAGSTFFGIGVAMDRHDGCESETCNYVQVNNTCNIMIGNVTKCSYTSKSSCTRTVPCFDLVNKDLRGDNLLCDISATCINIKIANDQVALIIVGVISVFVGILLLALVIQKCKLECDPA